MSEIENEKAEGWYDNRDDLVGGESESPWEEAANWSSLGDTAPTFDARKAYGGSDSYHSQADLAG